MPRRTADSPLADLALRFAAEAERIIEAHVRRRIAAQFDLLLGASPGNKAVAKKATKKIVVTCPAPGCKNRGVRTLSNFCVEHNRSLDAGTKKKLRAAQRAAQAANK